jgi:hypothetical protein
MKSLVYHWIQISRRYELAPQYFSYRMNMTSKSIQPEFLLLAGQRPFIACSIRMRLPLVAFVTEAAAAQTAGTHRLFNAVF